MWDVSDGFPLPQYPKVTDLLNHAPKLNLNSIGGPMDPVPEIRREKVFLQPGMSTDEIKKTYGLSSDQAYKARMKGFFIKNYMKKQIIIDPENFDPVVSYPLAKESLREEFFQISFSAEHQRRFDSGGGYQNV